MPRLLILLFILAATIPLYPAALAAEELDVSKADEIHKAAAVRSTEIATEALDLLRTLEALNEKAHGLGIPVSKLPEADRKIFLQTTDKLGALYAHNTLEASLVRDMEVLNNLYKAAMLLYSQQKNYVDQTGSAKGFDQYFAGLKLDRQQHFYMEILLYLQRLVPSALEANPGTPTPSQ